MPVGLDGDRQPMLERHGDAVFSWPTGEPFLSVPERQALLRDHLEPMLQRDLDHRGLVPEAGGYSATLIGWAEVAGGRGGDGYAVTL
jgi:hypothetical protein